MAGPTITIDPGTILTWDEATRLWMFARQMGLISGADWNVPTTPAEYQQLLTYVNLALQNKYNGLLYYGDMPAVAENVKAAMAVVPTDPGLVDTISAQPFDDIVTTGGSIGTVIATTPGGSYGFVKKGVALATALSLLGATLFAAQLSTEDKEDLEFTVEPFTDEDGNVICYTDEEGTTYLPEDFIEAVRQHLIAAGVYSGESYPEDIDDNLTVEIQNTAPVEVTPEMYTQHKLYLTKPSTIKFYRRQSGTPNTPDTFAGLYLINGGTDIQYTDYVVYRTTDYDSIHLCFFFKTWPYATREIGVHFANGEDSGYIQTVKDAYIDGNRVGYFTDIPFFLRYDSSIIAEMGLPDSFSDNTNRTDSVALCMFNGATPGGIDGIVPDPNAIQPSTAGRLMSEYFDDWYDNKKIFKGIHTDDEGEPDDIVDVTFLPATLHDIGGLDEDTTQNQSDAQEGTPPDDDSVTDILIEALEEFYKRITNDPVPPPTIPIDDSGDTPPAEPPVLSGSANGLWAIYNPTLAQVQNFGAYLWSENILDQITRMFNSPIDAVIGFHMIYCTPVKGPTQNIKCGYLDTGVASITVANQYATIDCGTVSVPEFYSTALDYSYTKLAVYLPFIGIVPLSTAVCMGASLQIIYRIDVLTGTCLAQIKVIKTNSDAVMYAFEGNCAVQIPLTATTYTGTVTALINSVSAGLSAFMGDYISAGQDLSEAVSGAMSKTGVKQSGSLGANAGVLGIRKPYLIITHPIAYDAREYSTQYGYPINQTVTLGSLNGYTRVKDIHLSNIPCTDDELEQIERLLKDGVIIN